MNKTVEEIREAKKKLQEEITILCNKFAEENELRVTDIQIETISFMSCDVTEPSTVSSYVHEIKLEGI